MNLESLFLFEQSKPRIPKISGLDYKDYIALILFCDALVDVAKEEAPTVHEALVQPGKDLIENTLNYFENKGVDIWKYVDRGLAFSFIKEVNTMWDGKLMFSDLVKFDQSSAIDLALSAIGHDVELNKKTKELLAGLDVESPTADQTGVSLDSKRYIGVYKALTALGAVQIEESAGKCRPYLTRAQSELMQARKYLNSNLQHRLDYIISQVEDLTRDS